MSHYKVWIEIEGVDGKGDSIDVGVLPDCVGDFKGKGARKEAFGRIADIVNQYGVDPENSDAVRIVEKAAVKFCKRCGTLLKKNGKCRDVTCPFSDRLQHETFTEG